MPGRFPGLKLEAINHGSRSKAFAPNFPKPKLAGWWLVMAEEDPAERDPLEQAYAPCSPSRSAGS